MINFPDNPERDAEEIRRKRQQLMFIEIAAQIVDMMTQSIHTFSARDMISTSESLLQSTEGIQMLVDMVAEEIKRQNRQ